MLAIAGDFDSQSILARITELFGGIPSGEKPTRLQRSEPEPNGEHHLDVHGPGETTFIEIAYRFPSATDPDFFPFMVLDSLLSGPNNPSVFGGSGISNKTSRLYRALVEKNLAVGVYGSGQVTLDPFLYSTNITLSSQNSIEEALLAYDKEILKIQQENPSEDEIQRAIKQARAIFAYGTENITHQAAWLGFTEMFANYQWFVEYLDNLAKVTPDDVMRIAQKWLSNSAIHTSIFGSSIWTRIYLRLKSSAMVKPKSSIAWN